MRLTVPFAFTCVVACACNGEPPLSAEGEPTALPSATPTPEVPAAHDPAGAPVPPAVPAPTESDARTGRFVVHEWGTFTNVVGSDGTIQPGLHHEEEDLPPFVADRMTQGQVTPSLIQQKMETPVTYFYAPASRRVSVKVGFPRGLF